MGLGSHILGCLIFKFLIRVFPLPYTCLLSLTSPENRLCPQNHLTPGSRVYWLAEGKVKACTFSEVPVRSGASRAQESAQGQLLLPRNEGQEDVQQLVGPETQAEVGLLH